jgi:hypothetical protein
VEEYEQLVKKWRLERYHKANKDNKVFLPFCQYLQFALFTSNELTKTS